MIIGLTGTNGAGKGTIVEFLEKRGFSHYSVRGFIIYQMQKKGMNVNENSETFRDDLRKVGNQLRAENSPSYITDRLYEQARFANRDAVIESFRNVGEIESLREKSDFYLLAVDARPQVRYERIRKRGSSTDNVSYEKFLEQERAEMSSTDPNKQNLSACKQLADFTLINNGSLSELEIAVDVILKNFRGGTSL